MLVESNPPGRWTARSGSWERVSWVKNGQRLSVSYLVMKAWQAMEAEVVILQKSRGKKQVP